MRIPATTLPISTSFLEGGSLEWPEADWNAVALWRLRNLLEGDEEGAEYEFGSGPLLPLLARSVWRPRTLVTVPQQVERKLLPVSQTGCSKPSCKR
jgi:hypothetical protein